MGKSSTFRKTPFNNNGTGIFAAALFLSSLFLNTAVEAREVDFEDIYPDYKNFLPEKDRGDIQPSFMNGFSFAARKNFPTLNGPPQCPYDTLKRGLKVPMLGKMDLRLFCVPKEQTEKSPEVKAKNNP
jgi:hypothetical protein